MDGLRRRTRLPPPRRNEYRVVRPAVRRFQSGARPDSGHVARRARKPAPACREGEGRTAARRQHQARAVPLATRRRIGPHRILDALLSFFQVFTMCSCAADTLTWPSSIRQRGQSVPSATPVRDWIAAVGAQSAYIEPGSPWENGYCESFNARFRDELLDREIFYSLREAQILIEPWRRHYNTKRPHGALDYRPPAPETIVPMDQRPIMH